MHGKTYNVRIHNKDHKTIHCFNLPTLAEAHQLIKHTLYEEGDRYKQDQEYFTIWEQTASYEEETKTNCVSETKVYTYTSEGKRG
jgi:hypothetical protein